MKKESTTIQIRPLVLKSLRESSGYSIYDIARKLQTTPEKIEEVEAGKSAFTITQIKKLANIYHRPLAAFFTDEPSKLPTIPDHRINREKKLTPEVHLAERRAYYLASKIAELSEKRSKIPTFPEALKADELANKFREYLGISLIKSKEPDKILAHYKEIIEEKLSILIIEYPLKADDVRAFSIFSDISVIVLNEQDEPKIKLFSLFHEICHLLKKTSAICSIEIEQKNKHEIESFCDLFAAEFLVPSYDLKIEVEKSGTSVEGISKLLETYGVSKQVIMLRLLQLRYIDFERYKRFKESFDKRLEEEKEGFRRKSWNKIFFNRVGNLAIQEVSNAYKRGDITFFESMKILNLKTKYVEKFVG